MLAHGVQDKQLAGILRDHRKGDRQICCGHALGNPTIASKT
jgi:hypothetical protein